MVRHTQSTNDVNFTQISLIDNAKNDGAILAVIFCIIYQTDLHYIHIHCTVK